MKKIIVRELHMKKIIMSILIILTVSTVFIVTTYSKEADINKFIFESKIFNSELLSKKLVRFHVIANSDTDVDQNVKLQVKDAVLQNMVPKLNASKSKQETIKIINENADNIKSIAESTLKSNNMTNQVTVVLNTTFFPTKYYNDFSLPAGDYLALRVIIGSGEGQNWWCVLFPPLCLVDVKKEEPIKIASITKEDHEEKLKVEESICKEVISQKLLPKEPETSAPSASVEKPAEKSSEKLLAQELQTEKPILEKNSNSSVNVKVIDESQKKSQNSENNEKPQIRWKALELLGLYKNSQNQ